MDNTVAVGSGFNVAVMRSCIAARSTAVAIQSELVWADIYNDIIPHLTLLLGCCITTTSGVIDYFTR